MSALRILIVEADPWVGMVLQEIILEAAEAEVSTYRSAADAENALAGNQFDFAFLDVNVTKIYGVAASLLDRDIPFAFMSGYAARSEVPDNLRHAPFIVRPYRPDQIWSLLRSIAE